MAAAAARIILAGSAAPQVPRCPFAPFPPADMPTLGEARATVRRRLEAAGIAAAALEARLLVARAIGAPVETVLGRSERPLSGAEAARLAAWVDRRAGREPLARILEEREFWSLMFRVSAETLVPRPDTETVVEAALAWAGAAGGAARRRTVLDLGTGTGCLLLALLSEWRQATGLGIDLSPGAAAVARDNAWRLGLAGRARFACGHWDDAVGLRFDVVVANPPYIPDGAIDGLTPEVAAFEPRRALDGGDDGLDAFRALAPRLAARLRPGGAAFLEVGAGQAPAVAALLERAGLGSVDFRCDLAGIARCVTARAAAGDKITKIMVGKPAVPD